MAEIIPQALGWLDAKKRAALTQVATALSAPETVGPNLWQAVKDLSALAGRLEDTGDPVQNSRNAMGGMFGVTTFHGSPHKFTKFSSAKGGTGEGTQHFGQGTYLAESPKVAEYYAGKGGRVYQQELPDEVLPKMLQWDKPLSEQPSLGAGALPVSSSATGGELYDALLTQLRDPAAVAQWFAGRGVPGVSYADRMGRLAGESPRSHVVWDTKLLDSLAPVPR